MPLGQFFKQIFEPIEKFEPTEKFALTQLRHIFKNKLAPTREFTPMQY
jgi:hypothetical protein